MIFEGFENFGSTNSKCVFRKGSRIKLDGDKAYPELIEIQQQDEDKLLQPKGVVDYAIKHPESELHKGFEWDKDKASYEYWLVQARQIIYNIRIVVEKPETNEDTHKTERTIEFVPFTNLPGEVGYRSTIEVYKNEETYEQLKKKAYDDLMYWKDKYENIIEFEKIFKDIEELNI